MTAQEIARCVQIARSAPPLTSEQRARIAALLPRPTRPAAGETGRAA